MSTILGEASLCVTASGGCQEYFGNWCRNGFKVGPDDRKPAAPVAADWIDTLPPGLT